MKTGTRKLGMWGALPAYLGGKRRLCPTIFREVDRILPRRHWPGLTFLDAFLGGGSVSLYAKAQGFRVLACDIAERATVVGQALIENQRVKLTPEDVLRLASPVRGPAGPIETKFCPSVFAPNQARFLDRALEVAAGTPDRAKAALYRLLAIRVALLSHPMSQVRPGTIHRIQTGEYESITESCLYHYVDGLRLTRPKELWNLAQRINAGVFQGEAKVIKRSVLDALPEIRADVAYFDPPYPGVMSYEKEYRIIDEMLEGHTRPTSPFTAKGGASVIDGLFERAAHIPIWVLSLGNAVVGLEELVQKMARLGRTTRAAEICYQHLPAVATEEKKATNREFLVVGWDPARVEKQVRSEAGHGSVGSDLDHLAMPFVEEHDRVGGTEISTFPGGLPDGEQESEPTLAIELAAPGRNSIAVSDRSMDGPDAVLEGGAAFDRKGRRT